MRSNNPPCLQVGENGGPPVRLGPATCNRQTPSEPPPRGSVDIASPIPLHFRHESAHSDRFLRVVPVPPEKRFPVNKPPERVDGGISFPDFVDLEKQATSFEFMAR